MYVFLLTTSAELSFEAFIAIAQFRVSIAPPAPGVLVVTEFSYEATSSGLVHGVATFPG